MSTNQIVQINYFIMATKLEKLLVWSPIFNNRKSPHGLLLYIQLAVFIKLDSIVKVEGFMRFGFEFYIPFD